MPLQNPWLDRITLCGSESNRGLRAKKLKKKPGEISPGFQLELSSARMT
jgi:hypothetical protein